MSYIDEEDVTIELFDVSALPEKTSIYYIFSEENELFRPKEVPNLVSAINIQTNLCFHVAKRILPVEDIHEMHSLGNMLTEAASYNTRILCHYISWDLKIRL